ncbi:MAG: FAD/NAD(P)-binding protein, partial [Rhodospirillaceae bacterium]|nr:FAD/NAD(P)-binding protein [Rhodospirillaceae bacterium]
MTPRPFRIIRRRRELADTFSLELEAEDGAPFAFSPGQFNMLYVFGAGEVPISISSDPATPPLVHTIRTVGSVTERLQSLKKGDRIGLRGPFGSAWPVADMRGHDVLIIAGGIGLAPLRPSIHHILANRADYGRVAILYGARSPSDILFEKYLMKWRSRFDTYVDVTVDRADARWGGKVGVVPKLIDLATFSPEDTVALICGPEIMMQFCVRSLLAANVARENIYLSMERSMKCAVGFCGHCQF